MKHYICTGTCSGVSDKPKACDAKDCSEYNKQLKECDCVDDLHKEAKSGARGEQKRSSENTT